MTKANSLSRWLAAAMAALMLLALLPARVWAAESTAYDTDGATAFTFTDSAITAKDGDYTGYDIDGTALTIEAAGTYIVSGSCQSGSITVKKGVTGVTLVLSGLTLTADGTAAIACNKSSGVTIVAQDGTTNVLSDTETNNDDSYPDNTDAENAVIKCKDGSQVTLCGSGSLTVNANGKNGIKSGATTDEEGEAWLVIRDLTLTISAPVNDAINAEASLTILSGDLTIDAGDDAVHSDYYLTVGAAGTDGPTITVNSCNEGLEAADLSIAGGNITIHAGDDCLNAANSDLTGYAFTLSISGGTLVMDTPSGDGIDSNGSITMTGGTVFVSGPVSGGDGAIDFETDMTMTGGSILALSSRGMMEYPSTQHYYTTSISANAGDFIAVCDADGNVLMGMQTQKAVSDVVYYGDQMDNCQLIVDGTYSGTLSDDGTATDGTVSGGTAADSFQLTDGSEQSSAPGNFGDKGGTPPNNDEMPTFADGEQPKPPQGEFGKGQQNGENGAPTPPQGGQPSENTTA